ncbi:MAG: hypothetical protein AAGA60_30265 [Cyanobacteria bacterium P01_E01_bin.42]
MLLEIRRVTTSEIEFETLEELISKLSIDNEKIAHSLWDFCESGDQKKLSEDSEIFLEKLLEQNRVDTETYLECEARSV